MAKLGRPPVFVDVVEEHFDELDFLLEHREGNVFTPDWTLRDLAFCEERIEAHLDGLRLSELHGVDLALLRLGSGESSAAAAATMVLVESGEPELRQRCLEALGGGEQPVVDGVRLALRHLDIEPMADALIGLAAGADPLAAIAAADVLAFHGHPVPRSQQLLATEEPGAFRLALGVAGRLGSLRDADLERALRHEEASVRRAALQAAARCGLGALRAQCLAAAKRAAAPDPECIAFLGVLGDRGDLAVLTRLAQETSLAAPALAGIGALGDVAAVPQLLDWMDDEVRAAAATQAYRRITGATDVEGEKPQPPAAVGDGDADDDALPPDPAKARADWQRRQGAMPAESLWQRGVAIPADSMPPAWNDLAGALTLEARRDVWLRVRSRRLAPALEPEALVRRQLRGGSDGAS